MERHNQTPKGIPEQPQGHGGLAPVFGRWFFEGAVPILDDCLAFHPHERPWLLAIWAPLATKAPSPAVARPWCCYVQTVIFYHRNSLLTWPRPWRDRAGVLHPVESGGFFRWDEVETRLAWDDVVAFEGENFTVGGGHVLWRRRRWWTLHHGRRVQQPA